jgi:mono/diheme cytochrome c family protein
MFDPDFRSNALIQKWPAVLWCCRHESINHVLSLMDLGQRWKHHVPSIPNHEWRSDGPVHYNLVVPDSLRRKTRLDLGRMDRRVPALVLLALSAVASSLQSGCHNPPSLTEQESTGKKLYLGRCAHCHEDNDLALKKAPPDLHHLFDLPKLPSGAPAIDAEIRRVILEGKGMMPAFTGRFNDEQMAALLAYLHTGLR